MFPTLSHLVNYLLGTDFSWPIPTFGFFVGLSFVLSYLTFRAEFVRKERIGAITAFEERTPPVREIIWVILIGYGVTGFLIGYKGIAFFLDATAFWANPFRWIFSSDGHLLGGLILSSLFVAFILLTYKRSERKVAQDGIRTVHPKELMPTLVLWAAVTGFIGAKLLNIFEDYRLYQSHSIWDMLRFSGLTFWGGLLFGATSYLYIGMRKGIDWRHLADIGSLGMLVAYGVGRIGCHLSGDGDWGIVNTVEKPFSWLPNWMWSFNFPHNVIHQGVYMPGCTDKYCYVLPEGVFPTSFYESTAILLAFAVLWIIKGRIKMPGVLFTIYLFVISIERFLIEFIRVNYKFDVFGFLLSEAQLVSLGILLLAVFMVVYLSINRYNKLMKSRIQF
ncbi:prolipoprotein diacylglyceryl transferase [Sphingobacterium pedocola]|uniref:Diacylglyceryl transferase n=1 Tax=Sphingobacterium pedocola TaxID=2082722 RepID=A0ABR9TBU3_9SPHI|nr:prolipoprotein diacylglyceryl transferase family protein [Sphingobacterium pedocola]MBE8722755.1 diacylglyceryl transferase [Sphingobacterium pedocola]